jgi:hypothetical protein
VYTRCLIKISIEYPKDRKDYELVWVGVS